MGKWKKRVRSDPSTMQSENGPFLVGQDITANLLLFALDRLYVCKHAVRLKPLCQFGCVTPPILGHPHHAKLRMTHQSRRHRCADRQAKLAAERNPPLQGPI